MMRRLLTLLLLSTIAFAQNRRVDAIALSRSGLPAPGASVAICSQTAISAISESGNTVTVTSTLAPPPINGTVTIFDVVPTAYNGTWAVVSSSPTQFTYFNPLTGLGAGTSFGAAITSGSSACSTPIALCSSPSDVSCVSPNPLTADGLGNYFFYLSSSLCTLAAPCTTQIFGSTLTTRVFPDQSYNTSGVVVPTPPNGFTPGTTLPVRFDYLFARGDSVVGLPNATFQFIGGLGNVSATATEVAGNAYGATASASANTIAQLCYNDGANPGQGFMSLGTLQRWAMRVKPTVASPVRYWLGLIDTFSSQCSSPTSITATDSPNLPYCAFRFSSGTDTTWKATCGTAFASQTVVDTGVALNTSSSTLFEISTTNTGASVTFYINGVSVGTITTNLPTASYNLAEAFFIDNKNTATAENLVFYWEQAIYNK